ncbi:TIGR01620 family protein [Pararhizobium mangrovi]|uniref:TIGR01620 family protein n=2 Tax=Pararhizobium mangrovi TaxID=2590452 RepID=A0A506UFW1_9HYPH|nr:TIGR01620 family protein [Pararhizobium mangrovi]TPW31955.1 TIGR01620 family protein [Pararhizobium mangrovi]
MSDDPNRRRPAAFRLDDTDRDTREAANKPAAEAVRPDAERPEYHPARRPIAVVPPEIVPDEDDPFIGSDEDALSPAALRTPRKRFSFAKLAAGAFSIVVSIAVGLWIDDLIRTLFERVPALAWATLALVAIGLAALLVAMAREVIAIYRLRGIQALKRSVEEATLERSARKARRASDEVAALLAHRPETASGRATLRDLADEVVDGPALIDLAETELLTQLDRVARKRILETARRVSVVTAVSPRAVLDILYVAYEAVRLVRAMATLYGGRPGAFGMVKLMRDTIAHLAVTGSIAIGDGIVQQILGHGVAAKLSSRLGEGVVNGMMTARIGIAAMDLCRPMPFRALRRPKVGEFIGDLAASAEAERVREERRARRGAGPHGDRQSTGR